MNNSRYTLAPFTRASHPAPVDVLLAHSFYMALDPKQAAKAQPYPPLATLQLAALLRREGFTVALFDSMLADGAADFAAAFRAAAPRLVILQEDNFNFLSKMCLSRMREEALAMIRHVGAAGPPVLVNGSDASDHPEVYLKAGAIAVARGEGDWSLLDAARLLLRAENAAPRAPSGGAPRPMSELSILELGRLPGISVRLGERRIDAPPRAVERDPDRFPDPDRSFIDLHAYLRTWRAAHGRTSLNLASSRGCPYHCNWCAKPIWGQRYSLRSVERVVAEIAAIASAPWAPDRLWFADDIFGLQPSWTEAFGRAMAEAGLSLPFQIQSRADLMTEGAVKALALAGCTEVWLGAESGDQAILDAMEKGITVSQIKVAAERLHRAGIRVALFLQFGYPGEDWPALMRTVALVREVLPDAIGISVSYPLPGTRFFARVQEELGDRRHWRDSRDLAMLYRGPFPSWVYRRVHRLLHRELDVRLAARSISEPLDALRSRRKLAELVRAWQRLKQAATPAQRTSAGLAPADPGGARLPSRAVGSRGEGA